MSRLSEHNFGFRSCAVFFLLARQLGWPQPASPPVNIQVHFDQVEGPLSPVWNYFGYDEPNYTYANNGKQLLGELAGMEPRRFTSAFTICSPAAMDPLR